MYNNIWLKRNIFGEEEEDSIKWNLLQAFYLMDLKSTNGCVSPSGLGFSLWLSFPFEVFPNSVSMSGT
jgi:hypothetical protein